MPSKFNSTEFIANLPARAGVYIFYRADKVLYVGKANNLRNRVRSYFRSSGLSAKNQLLTAKITRAEIQQTANESEALVLENDLIKKLRPRYNIQLRDDKSFPYIKLDKSSNFPRFTFYRGRRSAAHQYFGPYPNAAAVREILSHLHKIFQLRQCPDSVFKNRTRPCLQHQIKRCSAPCVNKISRAQYADDLNQAEYMLRGRDSALIEELADKMERASAELDYETAANYRDRIKLLQSVRGQPPSLRTDADAVAVAVQADMVCFGVVAIRQGRNLGGRFHLQKNPLGLKASELLSAFLAQNYLGANPPAEILVSEKIVGQKILEKTFARQRGYEVVIKNQCRTQRARWLASAQLNTNDYLRSHLAARSQIETQFDALAKLLNLAQLPTRIECFDISHTQGERAVGACVVFDKRGEIKNDYRRFNLTDIKAGDDYAAMQQTLARRYKRVIVEDRKLPDLILIDGGKGQLSAVKKILDELQLQDIILVGVAKGKARRAGDEVLYVGTNKRAIYPGRASAALHLIARVRDEAHRFAIAGHRHARAKSRTTSPLQEIAGVGESRRRALLRYFGGLREIARASRAQIASAPGISTELAQRIYDRFHS